MKTVIVGAGAIGLCVAYRLASRGHAVTVVDRGGPGAGASTRNAGWIAPALSAPVPAPGMLPTALRWMLSRTSPLHVRLSLEPNYLRFMMRMLRHCNHRDYRRGLHATAELAADTARLFDDYQRDSIRFEYHRDGLLLTFLTDAALRTYADGLTHLTSIGHAAEILTREQVLDLEGGLTPSIRGGIYCPAERHIHPRSFIDGLVLRCWQLGVQFATGHAVTGFATNRHQVTAVRTSEGSLTADTVIVAAGVWTGPLTRHLGAYLPIGPGKGYGYDLTVHSTPPRRPIYLAEAKVAVTPFSNALRAAGTMVFGDWDDTVDRRRAGGIVDSLRHYFPRVETAVATQPWSGLRPMTPDGLPCIGRLRPYNNVIVAAGHAMLGITLAPATAEVVNDQLENEQILDILRPFDPHRFD